MKLKIDPEFAALVPPLTSEEADILQLNIEDHGCRDPIVVWAGHGVILDGHNRFYICNKLLAEFNTVEVKLPDRDAAKIWIIYNQLGRRNTTAGQRAMLTVLLGKLQVGSNQHVRKEPAPNGAGSSRAENIDKTRVGKGSLDRASVVAKDGAPELASAVIAGKLPVSTAAQIAAKPKSVQRRVAAAADPKAEAKAVLAVTETAPPTPLEAACAALDELADAVKAARTIARRVFAFAEDKTPSTPYLGRFSYAGVIHGLTSYLHMLDAYRPIGGTPGKPLVARDKELTDSIRKKG